MKRINHITKSGKYLLKELEEDNGSKWIIEVEVVNDDKIYARDLYHSSDHTDFKWEKSNNGEKSNNIEYSRSDLSEYLVGRFLYKLTTKEMFLEMI